MVKQSYSNFSLLVLKVIVFYQEYIISVFLILLTSLCWTVSSLSCSSSSLLANTGSTLLGSNGGNIPCLPLPTTDLEHENIRYHDTLILEAMEGHDLTE